MSIGGFSGANSLPISWQAKFGRTNNKFINTLKFGYNSDIGANFETVWDDGGSSTQAYIQADEGQTQMATYTVRDGYYGLITGWDITVGRNDAANVELRTRSEDGIFRTRNIQELPNNGILALVFGPTCSPILIEPKTDVFVRAKRSGTGSIALATTFSIYEVAESEINL